MSFTRSYKEILRPEVRVSRSEIKPRNIYRISTYRGSKPHTKTGEDARYVFVIGIVDDKIHCIKLNDIRPVDFTGFLNKIRDRRIPIGNFSRLGQLVKKYSKGGSELFEHNIKHNSSIYSKSKNNYRIYILDKIVNVWEIQFEAGMLMEMFGETANENVTTQERRTEIKEEINEKDG